MVDMHTHILPGVDDGSPTLEVSRGLLQQEIDNGIKNIVLTPHQNHDYCCKNEMIEHFKKFKEDIKDLDVNLILGSEIYYHDHCIQWIKEGKYLTFNNTKYLLIEFSTRVETPIADIVYDLKVSGFKPIVAHIERYQYLTKEDYQEIKDNGALIQINAKSFENKLTFKRVKTLLKLGLVDFVASDCHNLENRYVDFEAAKKYIMKKHKDMYHKLFEENFKFED